MPAQGSKLRKQLEERMEEEARAIYWKNHRDELEAMGEGGQAGAPAAVALAQSPTGGGQDFVGGGNDAAPWDMLLQQAASGDVGGEGLETMGANLQGVPGSSPAGTGSGAAPGNAKAGNGNGGISQGKGCLIYTSPWALYSPPFSAATWRRSRIRSWPARWPAPLRP